MKGLATALSAVCVLSLACFAGSLEMSIGGGPSVISLDTINDSIGVFNALIAHLNDTFDVHPDVTGSVPLLDDIGTSLSFSAVEHYRPTGWLALGASVDYARSSSSTRGFYNGVEASEIAVDLTFQAINAVLGGTLTFLDVGIRLGITGGVGYYYAIVDHTVVFQIPAEYPDVIAGVPPEGSGRHTGGALGFDAGLSLSYPIAPWFIAGADVIYRSAQLASLTNQSANALDLDGDGNEESIDLSGLMVRFTFTISIDLSLGGGKE
ncbi:hypothetical protein KJ567_02130 [Candidatus Bipolaricaulota bacterium]|nr:hypothetical protein [Candidatus Bipolaricaulota bacterium]